VDVAAGLLVDPHTPGGLTEAAAGLLPCLDNLWVMHLPASLALLDQLLTGVFLMQFARAAFKLTRDSAQGEGVRAN
jgi:hypothetical protein